MVSLLKNRNDQLLNHNSIFYIFFIFNKIIILQKCPYSSPLVTLVYITWAWCCITCLIRPVIQIEIIFNETFSEHFIVIFTSKYVPFWQSSSKAFLANDPRTFKRSLTTDGVISLYDGTSFNNLS